MAFTLIHRRIQRENYLCQSTDTKPTGVTSTTPAGIPVGHIAYETDTGNSFIFDGAVWRAYTVSASGGTPAGINGDIQINNMGVFGSITPGTGVATLLAGTPSGTGGLAGTTSPTFTTGINGNNGGSGFTIAALGATNENILLVPHGNGSVIGPSGTSTIMGVCVGDNQTGIFRVGPANMGLCGDLIRVSANVINFGGAIQLTWYTGGAFAAKSAGITSSAVGILEVNNGNAGTLASLKAISIGLGVTPTYGIHGAWTSGLTANQTMRIQDASPSGITGIFFDAGAAQSTNPILTVAGILKATIFLSDGTVRFKGYTVATLPAGVVGDNAYVTDALAPAFLSTVVGGGAIVTPVFYNGTNWVGA